MLLTVNPGVLISNLGEDMGHLFERALNQGVGGGACFFCNICMCQTLRWILSLLKNFLI